MYHVGASESHCRSFVPRGEEDGSVVAFWKVINQASGVPFGILLPHVNIVGVVEDQKPLPGKLAAKVRLHKSFDISIGAVAAR
jgi:hypothetical protein